VPRLYLLVDLLGDVADWYDLALCRETDPEAFFPVVGGSPRRAKRVCARCEVRGPALNEPSTATRKGCGVAPQRSSDRR
jgi:hypothetical protein